MFTMMSEVVGRPSVVSGDLVQNIAEKTCERCCFTISELSCEFPQFSRTVSSRLSQARLSQVLRKVGSENAHGCAQNAEMALALTF
jgi:hypothetical protein